AEVSLQDFRKDVTIELLNEAGQVALAYHVHRCWVSEYVALPQLDASSHSIAIQLIKLENEGWIRDPDVTEPREPSYTGDEAATQAYVTPPVASKAGSAKRTPARGGRAP